MALKSLQEMADSAAAEDRVRSGAAGAQKDFKTGFDRAYATGSGWFKVLNGILPMKGMPLVEQEKPKEHAVTFDTFKAQVASLKEVIAKQEELIDELDKVRGSMGARIAKLLHIIQDIPQAAKPEPVSDPNASLFKRWDIPSQRPCIF